MITIFLFVPVLNCALLFWDDPCSFEKTIGSSDFIIRSGDKYIERTSSLYVHKGIAPPVRDTERMDGWMDGRMDGWMDGWMDR